MEGKNSPITLSVWYNSTYACTQRHTHNMYEGGKSPKAQKRPNKGIKSLKGIRVPQRFINRFKTGFCGL